MEYKEVFTLMEESGPVTVLSIDGSKPDLLLDPDKNSKKIIIIQRETKTELSYETREES